MAAEHRPDDYRPKLRVIERGRVSSVGDGIVWIDGLPSARMDGIVKIDDGSEALVVHLTARRIGASCIFPNICRFMATGWDFCRMSGGGRSDRQRIAP